MIYDKVIIGGGLYGLYAALFCGLRGEHVAVLEYEDASFKRATYINQARVHMGYHYPRSYSTAIKSAQYFERFCHDYEFSLLQSFNQIYATSSTFSWTNAEQFQRFCQKAGIKCEEVPLENYFKPEMCDGAFLTKEYTYDAHILLEYFLKQISSIDSIDLIYNARITDVQKDDRYYQMTLNDSQKLESAFVLNTTYASINQIVEKFGFEPFKIKYELCEIILCKVNDRLRQVGLTVMDGPFFSIMPFGKTGLHSLTAVNFTPHKISYDRVPTFPCQMKSGGFCTPQQLANCNECPAKPKSAWDYMSNLAHKYLNEDYQFEYASSLFSMKPILISSEIDDSRPIIIRKFSSNPTFISVLSGKINTVYDLDEVLLLGNN
jgi:hypothetical protein